MRKLLLALLVAPAVHAQVIDCPRFYPWEDTALAEVPYQHKGKGLVAKSSLSGAGIYTGAWNGKEELVGDVELIAEGRDARFGFEPGDTRWLVCRYGQAGEIQWWEELDRSATNCTLQVRGRGPVTAHLQCGTAKRTRTPSAAR